jgi:acyl-CoA dehydrogenase
MTIKRLEEFLRQENPGIFGHVDALTRHLRAYALQADELHDIPPDLWVGLDMMDLNLALVPPKFGGDPALSSVLRRTIVSERLGHSDAALAMALPGPGLSMPPIIGIASEEQQRTLFGRFLENKRPVWGAFAITEPSVGSDATAICTTARETDHGFVINGQKCFITNGARADFVVVFATIDKSLGRFGIRAFIVDSSTPGFSVDRVETMLGVRASQLAVLSFNDCEVPREAMLGYREGKLPARDAFTGAQGAWDFMRPVLSSVIVGTCCAMVDEVSKIVEDGQHPLPPSLSVKSMKDIMSAWRTRIDGGRMLFRRAAWKYDNKLPMSLDASMSKAYVSKLSYQIAEDIVALFGEQVLRRGSLLEKLHRDIKVFDILEGTGDMQRLMITKISSIGGRNFGNLMRGVAQRVALNKPVEIEMQAS